MFDLWMSNTKLGFLIRFTQNLNGRLKNQYKCELCIYKMEFCVLPVALPSVDNLAVRNAVLFGLVVQEVEHVLDG